MVRTDKLSVGFAWKHPRAVRLILLVRREPETHWVAQTHLKAGGTCSPAVLSTRDTRPVPLSAGGRVPEWVPEAHVLLLCPSPSDSS